ncbi:hypothetical protein BJX70DRAFT_391131 [Aspergillus crustosus]
MADKQNPIACEPCRQKKCKCDRILSVPNLTFHLLPITTNRQRPVCSQCSDPARCIYPESGKRGLPQGYITHLENRLSATERALYSCYAHLRTVPPGSLSIVESPQLTTSRTAAINEWSRLSLRNPADLERWWAEKNRLYGTSEGEAPSEWTPGAAPTISRDRDASASTRPNGFGHHSHIKARPSAGYVREGRAERLAELEPAIYF